MSFLAPECRVCTFDCTYCTFRGGGSRRWPRPGEIGSALIQARHRDPDIESITISGPGEPTLHPQFGMALANVLSASRIGSRLPVRVATNGTGLLRPGTRRLLEFADELIVRLDAGGARTARPATGYPLEKIVVALRELRGFSAESVFVDGPEGNTDGESVAAWLGLLSGLQPLRVYVTTIAGVPADGGAGVSRAPAATLEAIAARVQERIGAPVAVVP